MGFYRLKNIIYQKLRNHARGNLKGYLLGRRKMILIGCSNVQGLKSIISYKNMVKVLEIFF